MNKQVKNYIVLWLLLCKYIVNTLIFAGIAVCLLWYTWKFVLGLFIFVMALMFPVIAVIIIAVLIVIGVL
jgi:hypothetical protein